MNLVAKEFCASNTEQSGVLILSEFAGAASQLRKGAMLVNPYNIKEVSDALYAAWGLGSRERRDRMKKLQRSVARNDIFWWVNSFLNASISGNLDDFPLVGYSEPH
jgi:trehalose 6-phosphate synthase